MERSISVVPPEHKQQEYLDYLNYLIAHASLFTSSEFKVAAFCLYHTIRLNKRSASLSLRFMTKSVLVPSSSTGLGRKAVVDALRGLEKKQFLKVHAQYEANGRNLANIIEIFDPGEQLGQLVDNEGES